MGQEDVAAKCVMVQCWNVEAAFPEQVCISSVYFLLIFLCKATVPLAIAGSGKPNLRMAKSCACDFFGSWNAVFR